MECEKSVSTVAEGLGQPTFQERPLGSKDTNRAGAPDPHNVALLDAAVHNLVIRRHQYVGSAMIQLQTTTSHDRHAGRSDPQVKRIFIRDAIRQLEQVGVSPRHAYVFRLTAAEAAGEV